MARNCLLIAAEAPSSSSEASESGEGSEEEVKEKDEEVPGVWSHLKDVLPPKERERLERDAVERAKEEEKEKVSEANVYLGKPDMRPSWDGGGWGGPKDGHDMDQRFMLRGEARELPDYIYEKWKFHRSDDGKRLTAIDPDAEVEEKKKVKRKKQKKFRKVTKVPKVKKIKKEKKEKKKKEKKAKKEKKEGKKKRKEP